MSERDELVAAVRRAARYHIREMQTGLRLVIENAADLLERDGARIAELTAEVAARKGDPSTRLHNICAELNRQGDESPFSREAWGELEAENARLREAMKRQASAALTLADATKATSGHQLAMAQKMRAESQPELIESERAANARLTEELDATRAALAEARADNEALRKDAERYRWLRDDGGADVITALLRYDGEEYDALIDAEKERTP